MKKSRKIAKTVLKWYITKYFGPRCPDYQSSCECCIRWLGYDIIFDLESLNKPMKESPPENTENKIYIEDWEIQSVSDLFDIAQEKWGHDVDLMSLKIEHEHIQVK